LRSLSSLTFANSVVIIKLRFDDYPFEGVEHSIVVRSWKIVNPLRGDFLSHDALTVDAKCATRGLIEIFEPLKIVGFTSAIFSHSRERKSPLLALPILMTLLNSCWRLFLNSLVLVK
jgi:hypothetical protein